MHKREGLSSMQQRRVAQSRGAPAVVVERVDYHYQHAWDRVQHAPAVLRPMYCPLHYSVGVSDRQVYGVDGPDDPWSSSTRGVIGPNMHGANLPMHHARLHLWHVCPNTLLNTQRRLVLQRSGTVMLLVPIRVGS